MRGLKSYLIGIAAAAAFFIGGDRSEAAALVNIQILGSYNGSAFNANLVNIPAGGQVSFEVVGQIATVGTQNTHVTGGITSLSSADGIGSLSYNFSDSDGGVISGLSLANAFTLGSGPSAGTISGNGQTVTGVRPIGANGVFAGATSPVVLETGTLTAGSLATPEILSGVFGGTTSGARINSGAKSLVINTTSETSTDPYIGFAPLTITGAVPEPASVVVFAIASLGALARRRRAAM